MSIELLTELPSWLILLCILLGAAYATALYVRNRQNPRSSFRYFNQMLFVLRFLGVTILAVLLLNPLLKSLKREVQKPEILLAIDNSRSMILQNDSAKLRSEMDRILLELNDRLQGKYRIITAGFDEELNTDAGFQPDFSGLRTDIDKLLSRQDRILSSSSGRAVVLLSDGIYNTGTYPAYSAAKSRIPIHTIPFGDTTIYRDVRVENVRVNTLAFLGNEFPVEIDVAADRAESLQSTLSIWKGNTQLYSENFRIDKGRFTRTFRFMLKADALGTAVYQVRVAALSNERNTRNNLAYVSTEVIDGRQKILVNAHAPHPDIAALRDALESNEQYSVKFVVADLKSVQAAEYDLVITHQMPASPAEYEYISGLEQRKIPYLAVLGNATRIDLFNKLESGARINGNRSNQNQVLPLYQNGFDLFEIGQDVQAWLKKVPPLSAPFGEYSSETGMHVLLQQQIGSVRTDMPLLSFRRNEDYKSGVLYGEGIWRWRFFDQEQNGTSEHFREIIGKSTQFLSIRDDKRKFRVKPSASSIFENEAIHFRAELYNANYEPVNESNVELKIVDAQGKDFTYLFQPAGKYYQVNPGSFPVGLYTYTASTALAGRKEQVTGSFMVKPLVLEEINLTANHRLLRQISANSKGVFAENRDLDRLIGALQKEENTKSIVRAEISYRDVIDLKWLFALLFTLFALEWIARRWAGSY